MAYEITLDGVTYTGLGISKVSRIAEIKEDNTGALLMSGEYRRGIIGTYVSYKMSIERHSASLAQYDAFYEAITAPDASHTFIAPYAQGTINIDIMVDSVEDGIVLQNANGTHWSGMIVEFKTKSPYRR